MLAMSYSQYEHTAENTKGTEEDWAILHLSCVSTKEDEDVFHIRVLGISCPLIFD